MPPLSLLERDLQEKESDPLLGRQKLEAVAELKEMKVDGVQHQKDGNFRLHVFGPLVELRLSSGGALEEIRAVLEAKLSLGVSVSSPEETDGDDSDPPACFECRRLPGTCSAYNRPQPLAFASIPVGGHLAHEKPQLPLPPVPRLVEVLQQRSLLPETGCFGAACIGLHNLNWATEADHLQGV